MHPCPLRHRCGRVGRTASIIIIALCFQISVFNENSKIPFSISVSIPGQRSIIRCNIVHPVGTRCIRDKQIIGNRNFIVSRQQTASICCSNIEIILIPCSKLSRISSVAFNVIYASARSSCHGISALQSVFRVIECKICDQIRKDSECYRLFSGIASAFHGRDCNTSLSRQYILTIVNSVICAFFQDCRSPAH